MAIVSHGDLTQPYTFGRGHARLKAALNVHSQELVTGVSQNLSKRLNGNFSQLAGIETKLKQLETYKVVTDEAAFFASAMQSSLEAIQSWTSEASSNLLLSSGTNGHAQIQSMAQDAKLKFESVVSTLNTQVGGRSVFAGDKTDTHPLVSASSMLADLKIAIAGETTADGVASVVDDWFNLPGGGFDTSGYLGSNTPLAPQTIGQGKQAEISIKANDPAIRETLKSFAMAALATDGPLDGNNVEQSLLLQKSGENLITANSQQIQIQAGLGATEGFIESIKAQNGAEKAALEMFRSESVSVDPYEAATNLQAVQTQLETMYTLTARMSRLSLMDFLR